jgi:hypothetical protein
MIRRSCGQTHGLGTCAFEKSEPPFVGRLTALSETLVHVAIPL